MDEYLAAAEKHKPGIIDDPRLRDPIAKYERLQAQRDAHMQLLEKPVTDLRERLDMIRSFHGLKPLAQADPIDRRDRTVAQADVIRLKLHASLDAARQDSKMTGRSLPAHLHASLVRELDAEYQPLSDEAKGIVATWSDHFLNARREKARND